MFKKVCTLFLLMSLATLLLAACGTTGSQNENNKPKGNEVHMNNTDFIQSSITIKKGESITLIADTFAPHVIANGTWDNGTEKPATEPGAPEVKDLNIGGNSSADIGPFNTAGTFKLYCPIHKNMNLTVIVE